mmetsp:Transcript_5826/g.6710  ORF Transcript_5826/g.6710 Transcript_5826/m.6710 type:complete len:295 (-) Transcript_5826:44-928(-)
MEDIETNKAVIRCKRCSSRILSPGIGVLASINLVLPVSSKSKEGTQTIEQEIPEYESFKTWWKVKSNMDFDNIGFSRVVNLTEGEHTEITKLYERLLICSDCEERVIGVALLSGDVYLCKDLVDNNGASTLEHDFAAPAGITLEYLKSMQSQMQKQTAKSKTETSHDTITDAKEVDTRHEAADVADAAAHEVICVTFVDKVLGLRLRNGEAEQRKAFAGEKNVVIVQEFTRKSNDEGMGLLLPAEASGKVKVGDIVQDVNHESVLGLDFSEVLKKIISAPRPIQLTFRRLKKQP